MSLRYSFGLLEPADLLEKAIANVLAQGLRTKDIAAAGQNAVGTREMGDAILREAQALAG
jgi:3-isopropylmalate dehydrogenase